MSSDGRSIKECSHVLKPLHRDLLFIYSVYREAILYNVGLHDNKNQGFFYNSLPFLVDWFVVSKLSLDDCWRFKCHNHGQDQKKWKV